MRGVVISLAAKCFRMWVYHGAVHRVDSEILVPGPINLQVRHVLSLISAAAILSALTNITEAQVSMAGSGGVSSSGAYTYSIPIRIPPGTTAVQPSISLSYSSQSGNGIAGVGWNLSGLSVITRCPTTIATDGKKGGVNLDSSDKLCLDGKRLLYKAGTGGGAYGTTGAVYFTEIFDGNRITQRGSASANPYALLSRAPSSALSSVIQSQQTTGISSYNLATGSTSSSLLAPKSNVSAEVAPSVTTATANDIEFYVQTKAGELMEYVRADLLTNATTAVTRMWLLSRVTDTHGNYWTVDYFLDSANGEYLPLAINYTGNAKAAPNLLPYNKVEFVYDPTPRSDSTIGYLGGLKVSNTRRLSTIRTWATQSGGTSMMPVTEYRLSYLTSSGTQRSLLQQVQECATDSTTLVAATWSCLNPLSFTYNHAPLSITTQFSTPTGYTNPAVNGGLAFRTADVNGDSRTDYIIRDKSGTFSTLSSTPNGMVNTGSTPTPYSDAANWFESNRWWAMDMDGDGITDMVGRDQYGSLIVLKGKGDGTFASATTALASAGLRDDGGWDRWSRFFPMDVDGDGRMDLVARAGDGNLYTFLSNGTVFKPATGSLTIATDNNGFIDDNAIFVGDFNGDGKADFLFKDYYGTMTVYLSNGTGFYRAWSFDSGLTEPNLLYFSPFQTPNRVFVLDINGDGKSDILTRDANGVFKVWLSSGKDFIAQQPFTIPCINCNCNILGAALTPADTYHDYCTVDGVNGPVQVTGPGITTSFIVADVNGDGMSDLLFRRQNVYPTGVFEVWLSNGTNLNYSGAWDLGNALFNAQINGAANASGDSKGGLLARDQYGTFFYVGPSNIGCTDCMVSTKSSLGLSTNITYESTSTSNRYYGTPALYRFFSTSYPKQVIQPTLYVVGSINTDNAIGTQNTLEYWYGNALNSLDGRGFLGFEWQQNYGTATNGIATRHYYSQSWPFVGMTTTTTSWSGGLALSRQDTSFGSKQFQAEANGACATPVACVAGQSCLVSSVGSISKSWDIDTTPDPVQMKAGTPRPQNRTKTSTDCYGNPISILTETLNGLPYDWLSWDATGGAAPTPKEGSPTNYSKSTTNEYINDTNNWWIGRLKKSTVTSTKPAN